MGWTVRAARPADAGAVADLAGRLAEGPVQEERGFFAQAMTRKEYDAIIRIASVTVAESEGRLGAFLVTYDHDAYRALLPDDMEQWRPLDEQDRQGLRIPPEIPLDAPPARLEELFAAPLAYIAQVGKDPALASVPLGRLLYADLGRRVARLGQRSILGAIDLAPHYNRKSFDYHIRQYGARFFAVRRETLASVEWVSLLGFMPLEAFAGGARLAPR